MSSQATGDSAQRRYTGAAIALHWIIALGILIQIGLGWYMGTLGRTPAHESAEQVHISIGLTVLILTLLRVGIRLTHRPPALPADMPGWERTVSGIVHALFYILIVAIPISGWVMESLGPRPIPFWGLAWPHVPGFEGMTREERRPLHETIEAIHGTYLVWTTIALLALHVAGAVKHQFDGRPVLWRMSPFLRPPAGKV